METLAWILTGGAIGWVSYSGLRFNEGRGRNASIILGTVGALIGAKAIAPMFIAAPAAGGFSASGFVFAAAAAAALLALGNLAFNRWGV